MKDNVEQKNWIFNKGNAWFIVIVIILLFALFGTWIFKDKAINNDTNADKQVQQWKSKVDKLTDKNNQTIYMPKAGDLQVTNTQAKAIKDLTQLFNQLTTFNSITAYKSNLELAHSKINDPNFYNQFMVSPTQIENGSLMRKNIKTQVLVTGANSYQVVTIYVSYHNDSDLDQLNILPTVISIFNVSGLPGQYNKVTYENNYLTALNNIKVGDIQ